MIAMTRKQLRHYLDHDLIPVFRKAKDTVESTGDGDLMWRLVDTLTNGLATALGDTPNGWLNYYLWDCNCGDTPKRVVLPSGKKVELDTTKKLVKLLMPKEVKP